jgi:hypothetical protein
MLMDSSITVAEVVRQLRVSPATLYRHLPAGPKAEIHLENAQNLFRQIEPPLPSHDDDSGKPWQIELTVNQRVAPAAGISGKYTGLAILERGNTGMMYTQSGLDFFH